MTVTTTFFLHIRVVLVTFPNCFAIQNPSSLLILASSSPLMTWSLDLAIPATGLRTALARSAFILMMGWMMEFLVSMTSLASPARGLSRSLLVFLTAQTRLSFSAPSRWKLVLEVEVEVDWSTTVSITITISTILPIGDISLNGKYQK